MSETPAERVEAGIPGAEPADHVAMTLALESARRAIEHDDVPVGAVVVFEGGVVSTRHNEREFAHDPLAHAEILAIRDAASSIGVAGLRRSTLFVTLEPCVMCAGAIRQAGFAAVVFGAFDPKAGGCGSRYDVLGDVRLGVGPVVRSGILAEESVELLRAFFVERRA